MNKGVIFGAGNIGRSFIGSLFSKNGMEVTFVDANAPLVEELNRREGYSIVIKRNRKPDEKVPVANIRALHSSDTAGIVGALAQCDLCATSVGQGALPHVIPLIALGIKARQANHRPPLDIIIAENMRNGGEFFRSVLRENGLKGDEPGLVETSIGKMVPLMTAADLAEDPLVLFAEEYNTLILDKNGFKGPVPPFPEIRAVENISAWVDRKLFVHNLGHAAAAYLGYSRHPGETLIAGVLEDETVLEQVRGAMEEACAGLLAEYPREFTRDGLKEHVEDLLFRFQNRALGDTVFRVGRDLARKLNRDDRILGAAALCGKHGLLWVNILKVFSAALGFKAPGEDNHPLKKDLKFLHEFHAQRLSASLVNLCGLDGEKDARLLETLLRNI